MTKKTHASPASAFSTGAGQPVRLRADQPDPEAKALLRLLNLGVSRPLTRANLARQRLAWRASVRVLGRADPVARVVSLRVPGPAGQIELKVYRRALETGPLPAFLWIHGGGFLVGGLASADAICRHLAQTSGVIVVAVGYRLAPEYDLYAGREDCLAALQWLASEGASVGIDTARLAIGGDSAGGNLAAAVAQRHSQLGGVPLRLQVLAYPATNLRDDFASKAENARGCLLTSAGIDAIKALLAEGRPDFSDPWLSPVLNPKVRGLPPVLMIAAGFDPIRDDGLAYAARLRQEGVPVDLLHYPGQFHGFLNFNGVLRAARDGLDRIGGALRQALNASADVPYAVDRSTEVTVRSPGLHLVPGERVDRDLLLLGLMLGEVCEGWRASAVYRWFPPLGLAPLNPFLSPVTAVRAFLAQGWAPLRAEETYRREGTASPGSAL